MMNRVTLTDVGESSWSVDPAWIASITPAADGGTTVTISEPPRSDGTASYTTTLHVEESEAQVAELIEQARGD